MHNFCDPLKKLLLEQDFLQVATIDIWTFLEGFPMQNTAVFLDTTF